jgi:hypothetical protein
MMRMRMLRMLRMLTLRMLRKMIHSVHSLGMKDHAKESGRESENRTESQRDQTQMMGWRMSVPSMSSPLTPIVEEVIN